ncbi:MAG: DUF7405 family protein [Solirubrobacteraceae bacterium]
MAGKRHELDGAITRRTLLQRAAGLGVAVSTMGALDLVASIPERAAAATKKLPEIQFQIEKYLPPAFKAEGVRVRLGPLYTTFATIALTRTPTAADQATLTQALAQIEAGYPFTPSGIFTTVAYGIPYFQRLPGGMSGALVSSHMPRLASEPQRYVLAEAVPGPTDVSSQNPGVSKQRFNVPVQIESNDMLVTLRSDSSTNIDEVLAWLTGESSTLAGRQVGSSGLGGLMSVTSRRLMFVQEGLPRKIAEEHALPYAETISPQSPMWMSFISSQVGSSAAPAAVTFAGNRSAKLTNARAGDYFGHGSIQHLSHLIQDLQQFYERPNETYVRRVAAMFGSNPLPSQGNQDQFTDGGGPVFLANKFSSPESAAHEAEGTTAFDHQHHLAHTTALQRSSRAADNKPLHIRADGPGFDSLDVPDGSQQPKLHFSIFVPTADFFRTMRTNQASLDLAQRYNVSSQNLGIERFITATRRQNFLVPPRRTRAFPLIELT